MDELLDPNYYLFGNGTSRTGPSERKIRQRYGREKSLPPNSFSSRYNDVSQNAELSQNLTNKSFSQKFVNFIVIFV